MDTLPTKTVHLVAECLPSEFCKVLEFVLADNGFTVRAGVGWGQGVVGVAQVGAISPPRQGLPSKLASRSSQTILATNSGFARRSCLLVTVFRQSVCQSWLGAVVLSLNWSAALMTMKAGLVIRSCSLSRR